MTTDYSNKDCMIQTCSFCGYKYKEKYSNHSDRYSIDVGFGRHPFKQGLNKFVYQEPRDYAPDDVVQETMYACPKCGILQIESEVNVD